MSKSKRQKRISKEKKSTQTRRIIENPLQQEVNSIKKKINEKDKEIASLKKENERLSSNILDMILMNSEINDLFHQYYVNLEKLKIENNKQLNRKNDLKHKNDKLKVEGRKKIEIETKYMKIGDEEVSGAKIGLYNKICRDPVAICKDHQVYLSYEDIRRKRCLKHRNKKPCKHLCWLKDEDI